MNKLEAAKVVTALFCITLAVILVLKFTSFAPTTAATPLLLNWDAPPKTLEELRLHELENKIGSHRNVWGMQIPPGKKLIVLLSGGDAKNKPSFQSLGYEITGPLDASFAHSFSLIKEFRPLADGSKWESITLEVQANGQRFSSSLTDFVIPLQPDWTAGWSACDGLSLSSDAQVIYHEAQGPGQVDQIALNLKVSIAPANPAAKPGEITFLNH